MEGFTTICVVVIAAFGGIILLAYIVKMREVRRAARWPSTTGTVTASKVGSRKETDMDGKSSYVNEPQVTYEYEVNGVSYQASRISLAERIAGADVQATLSRYPAGKSVPVYYDPDDPEQAVLERAVPPTVGKGVGLLILLILGAGLLIWFGLGFFTDRLAAWLPNPENALFVTLAAGMGVAILLFALVLQRQVRATQEWGTAQGRILSSESEAYRAWTSNGESDRKRTFYRASVAYAYQVGGQEYINDRVSLGGEMSWSSPGYLRRLLERYPEGSMVTVYYNPDDPGEAALERRASGLPILIGAAVLLLVLAVVAGGLI
jgi:hypothetical protein